MFFKKEKKKSECFGNPTPYARDCYDDCEDFVECMKEAGKRRRARLNAIRERRTGIREGI
jgi:hypothetical protein